jgi:hypothetical protein
MGKDGQTVAGGTQEDLAFRITKNRSKKTPYFGINSVHFSNNSQKYTYLVWSLTILSYFSFIDLTQMLSQLKSLSLCYSNQPYNYFYAYSFEKKFCEILKSSKTKFGRNHHTNTELGAGQKCERW